MVLLLSISENQKFLKKMNHFGFRINKNWKTQFYTEMANVSCERVKEMDCHSSELYRNSCNIYFHCHSISVLVLCRRVCIIWYLFMSLKLSLPLSCRKSFSHVIFIRLYNRSRLFGSCYVQTYFYWLNGVNIIAIVQ